MATLAELRAKAKGLGIAASVIRGASTVKELQSVISDFNDGEKPAKRTTVAKKKSTTQAPAKRGPGRPKGSRNKPKVEEEAPAPKRRGRPPGSGVKKSASSTKAPARSQARRPARKPQADDAGRFLLESIDYSITDGWNPRPGSPPDRIVKALRKFRGSREKVFEFLKADVYDFVDANKPRSQRRPKSEALTMLKYRIARTDWEFATRTDQHQKSQNRAEYGSQSGNGNSRQKAAPRKAAATPAKRGPGRPRKVAEAPQEAPKRRGRPPGSKNKPKAQTAAKRTTTKAASTGTRQTATRRTATRRSRR